MKTNAYLLAAAALVLTLAEWTIGMALCGWEFAYPLDDSYIHVAIAKQLASSGTWGIEAGHPVFASSSPLWTLMLAVAFKLSGVHEWFPLLLAATFGFFAIVLSVRFWEALGLSAKAVAVSVFTLVLCTPLIALVNLGMEHSAHFMFVAMLLFWSWKVLKGDCTKGSFAVLGMAAFLGTAARYEMLFVTIPVSFVFMVSRRFRDAISVVLCSVLPILLVGCYAESCGGTFLPVSLLLKGGVSGLPGLSSAIYGIYGNLSCGTIHMLVLMVLLLVAALLPAGDRMLRLLSFAMAISVGGHLVFARLGWLYRYEAYLVGAGCVILPPLMMSLKRTAGHEFSEGFIRRTAGILLAAVLGFPFVLRGLMANCDTVLAQREIFGQQVQLGRIFASLDENLKGPIALNDLGYIALHSGVHVLDVWGLGSADVADMRLKNAYTADACAELFRKHKIRYAAFFPNWYDPKSLSPDLRIVATLSMQTPQIICGGTSVSLGVMREEDVKPFGDHLRKFAARLPEGSRLEFRN